MFDHLGIYALGGALLGFWQQVRGFLIRCTQYFVEQHTTLGWTSLAMQTYLMAHAKRHRFGARTYDGQMLFIRPLGRVATVAVERIGEGTTLFWLDGKPLWVSKTHASERDRDGSPQTTSSGSGNQFEIKLYWLRGTFVADDLHIRAVDYANATGSDYKHRRHSIVHVTGSNGKLYQGKDHAEASPPLSADNSTFSPNTKTFRYLKWQEEDLHLHDSRVSSIDQMSLTDELLELVTELKEWHADEKWCQETGVPHQFGVKLEGEPGTGKSAFVRAVAEDLDMPIYIYSLSTLLDEELINVWRKMLSCTPCIALFEDMDGVFHGRTPRGKTALSFDTLLNVLQGVERCNGLLVFMTTNEPDKLDPALTRKGRIDRTVQMPKLDAMGRHKMAKRILRDFPHEQAAAVVAGEKMTGAEFQDECITRARSLRRAAKGLRPSERLENASTG